MKVLRLLALLALLLPVGMNSVQAQDTTDVAIVPVATLRYYSVPNTLPLSIQIVNIGNTAIKSMVINLSVNGGAPVAQPLNISGNGLPKGAATNAVPLQSGINLSAAGAYSYTVTLTDIVRVGQTVITPDRTPENNEWAWTVYGIDGPGASDKKVLLEEFTGAWCGWCPDGYQVVETIMKANPNRIIPVMLHNGDAMKTSEGDMVTQQSGVRGFPSAQIDRYTFGGGSSALNRGTWGPFSQLLINGVSPVEFSMTSSYNADTREAQVSVEAEFLANLEGDFRFNLYVVEDSLTGSGAQWDQRNFTNNDTRSKWYNKGDPMTNFQHMHVLRQMVGGVDGVKGTMTNMATKGTKYNHIFTFTLNNNFKAEHVKFAGFVARNSTDLREREIYNADIVYPDGKVVGINDLKKRQLAGVSVYPNPAVGQTTVSFDLKHNQSVSINVMDIQGRSLRTESLGMQIAGSVQHTLSLDGIAPGNYFVSVTAGDHSHIEQIVVQ